MRRVALAAGLVVGCGAHSHDSGDAGPPPPPVRDCGVTETRHDDPCRSLRFTLETHASCAISLTGCGTWLDGEAFQRGACGGLSGPCTEEETATLEATDFRALALNRCGAGHVVGWCDGTTLADVFDTLDLGRYLGRRVGARVATVGGGYGCAGETSIPRATHLGATLPERFVGDAELLAAEWDVVVLCPDVLQRDAVEAMAPTLSAFVREHGGGLLVSLDYAFGPEDDRFPAVGALTRPCGFVFEPIALGWSTASADLACVPDY